MAILSRSLCLIDKARPVISAKMHNGKLQVFPGKNGMPTPTDWINTNRLLWKDNYFGIKTGHTP